MARRYLPTDRVGPYIEFARHEHRIQMSPERWLLSDFAPMSTSCPVP